MQPLWQSVLLSFVRAGCHKVLAEEWYRMKKHILWSVNDGASWKPAGNPSRWVSGKKTKSMVYTVGYTTSKERITYRQFDMFAISI